MIWLLLFVVLALIFGLGTVLEAALWVLLVLALVVLVGGYVGARTLGRRI